MKARNSATDTIAARKRREVVMPCLHPPLEGEGRPRSGRRWDDGAAAFTPTRRRFASSTSPLAGGGEEERVGVSAHVTFLILKLLR